MAEARDVVIIGEVFDGRLSPISGELAAVGTVLAQELGGELVGLLAGDELEPAGQEFVASGAPTVHLVESGLLRDPQPHTFVTAVAPVLRELAPAVVLMGKTALGADVGPRLAVRLDAGFVQDCVGMGYDQERGALIATRPVYGGASLARVAVRATPAMATLRPKAFDPIGRDASRRGDLITHQAELDPAAAGTRLVERVKGQAEGVPLEAARVVVGGGRGLGGPEPFQILEELAGILGGAVGASRAACDAGWIDHSSQVGLTGKNIGAELYITVGISGASQHLAGISMVKSVVAINKDGGANIFKEARFGVVGTWEKVLPSFLETVRELVRS